MNKAETFKLITLLKRIDRWSYSDTSNIVRTAGREYFNQPIADVPLERFTKPMEAGEFINQKTRLWRESWLMPELRAIVEKYAKQHGIDLKKALDIAD